MIVQALQRLAFRKTRDPKIQFLRYLVVGGSSSVVDLVFYAFCTEILHLNVYLAALAGYTLGFAWNHFLSVLWIFESKHSRRKEIVIAYGIALGGLLWTESLLFLFVEAANVHHLPAKMLTQVLVLAWNFTMRKKFVFH